MKFGQDIDSGGDDDKGGGEESTSPSREQLFQEAVEGSEESSEPAEESSEPAEESSEPAEESSEPATEGAEENNALFGEDPEADAEAELDALEEGEADADSGDEEDDEDGLFSKSEDGDQDKEKTGDKEKPVSQKAFKKRISKLSEQKREARQEAAAARQEANDAKQKAARLEGVLESYGDRYKGWKDPAQAARFDADFMDAAEEVAKNDRDVALALDRVKNHMGNGRTPAVSDAAATTTTTPSKPAQETSGEGENQTQTAQRDPAVEKLVRRGAEAEINSTLKGLGVKESFQKVLRNHIINASGVDLAELDSKTVTKLSRDFIRENGFTSEDVLSAKARKSGSDGDSKKPSTSGGPGGAAKKSPSKQSSKGGQKKDEGPRSRDEWEGRHESRLSQLASQLEG